jgi:hypothetical protein
MSKTDATWHPRTTAPWVCAWCRRAFPTDGLCELHEPRCPEREASK